MSNVNKPTCGLVPNSDTKTYINENNTGNVMHLLYSFFKDGIFCDTLVYAGVIEYSVHKCILGASSETMSNFLQVQEKTSTGNFAFTMPSDNENAVESFLEYLYTGKLNVSLTFVEALMNIAVTLGVDFIEETCVSYVRSSVNISNWEQIFHIVANTTNKSLYNQRQYLLDFATKNFQLFADCDYLLNIPPIEFFSILSNSNKENDSELELTKLKLLMKWTEADFNSRKSIFETLLLSVNKALIDPVSFKLYLESYNQAVCLSNETFIAFTVDILKTSDNVNIQITDKVSCVPQELIQQENANDIYDKRTSENMCVGFSKSNTENISVSFEQPNAEHSDVSVNKSSAENIDVDFRESNPDSSDDDNDADAGPDLSNITDDFPIIQIVSEQEASLGAKKQGDTSINAENEVVLNTEDIINIVPIIKHQNTEKEISNDFNGISENKHPKKRQKRVTRKSSKATKTTRNLAKGKEEGDGDADSTVGSQNDITNTERRVSQRNTKGKSKKFSSLYASNADSENDELEITSVTKKRQRAQKSPQDTHQKDVTNTGEQDNESAKTTGKTRKIKSRRTKTFGTQTAEKEEVQDMFDEYFPDEDSGEDSDSEFDGESTGPKVEVVAEATINKLKKSKVSPKRVRHKRAKKDEERFKCPKCHKTFELHSEMNHHLHGHGSDVPYLCETCGFTTKHRASMNVHKTLHTGNRLKCTFDGCNYETTRQSRLDDHINQHKGIKLHVCSVCGKAFAGKRYMSRHEKIHVEVKPIVCEVPECDYRTVRNDKLKDHIKKHHPELAVSQGFMKPEDAIAMNMSALKKDVVRSRKKPKKDKRSSASQLFHSFLDTQGLSTPNVKSEQSSIGTDLLSVQYFTPQQHEGNPSLGNTPMGIPSDDEPETSTSIVLNTTDSPVMHILPPSDSPSTSITQPLPQPLSVFQLPLQFGNVQLQLSKDGSSATFVPQNDPNAVQGVSLVELGPGAAGDTGGESPIPPGTPETPYIVSKRFKTTSGTTVTVNTAPPNANPFITPKK